MTKQERPETVPTSEPFENDHHGNVGDFSFSKLDTSLQPAGLIGWRVTADLLVEALYG